MVIPRLGGAHSQELAHLALYFVDREVLAGLQVVQQHLDFLFIPQSKRILLLEVGRIKVDEGKEGLFETYDIRSDGVVVEFAFSPFQGRAHVLLCEGRDSFDSEYIEVVVVALEPVPVEYPCGLQVVELVKPALSLILVLVPVGLAFNIFRVAFTIIVLRLALGVFGIGFNIVGLSLMVFS